jgi:hypothetical protein
MIPPGFHVNVPPWVLVEAFRIADWPAQMVALVAVIVGVGLTVTVPDATGAAHPAPVL